ncbi:MAG: LamG-like jellyroll fold domain-containing protein, partial [Peptococcia bacterium]
MGNKVKKKIMALVVILTMLLQCLPITVLAASEEDTALVGQWGFDEGAGTTAADTSGNDNHGTIAGPTWTNGVVGKALSFSGNGCVEVPHHAFLNPRNALTIEAWINPSTNMNWRKVISKSLGSNTDYSIFQGSESNLAFSLKMGNVARTVYSPANSVPLGEWTYVVGTYDGSRVKLYLNGTLVKTINISGEINAHNEPLRIGGEKNGAYFEGMIDEVKIYNEALSAAEIQDRYNAAVNPVEDATISPQEVVFDKNSPSDVTVTMELNGNELVALKNGEEELVNNTDYIISEADDTVTIKQEYLMQQPIGITNITFDFSAGNDPVLAITIEDNEIGTCVGQWSFDEGAGTTAADTSGNDNHGTIAGPTWTNGVVGKALSFSGNGCVEVPHHASLNPRNALTIEAWINPSTNMNWRKVISKSVGNNTDYSIFQGAE